MCSNLLMDIFSKQNIRFFEMSNVLKDVILLFIIQIFQPSFVNGKKSTASILNIYSNFKTKIINCILFRFNYKVSELIALDFRRRSRHLVAKVIKIVDKLSAIKSDYVIQNFG